MKPDLAASYRCAEKIARTRARNFYYSFVVLPAEKRRAFCAVYAFMRACDDVSDGPGGPEEKRIRLKSWRGYLQDPHSENGDEASFLPAFHDTVRRFSIPLEHFHGILDGTEMDLTVNRYRTFDDLYRYCFNVASCVGLVSLQIFGYSDPRARQHAEHCGIAFQLTNILRDIKEDAGMGRIYIPEEDLARFDYGAEELIHGVNDGRFQALMAFEAGRAQEYYRQARALLPMVEDSARSSLWAMMEIYGRLLAKIVHSQFDIFGPAIRLTKPEKAAIAVRALAMRCLR